MVDGGRYGYGDIGVPPSSALDSLALTSLNLLLGSSIDTAAIEVVGPEFSLAFTEEMAVALTGAKVLASVDGEMVRPWATFAVRKGSLLRVSRVLEGFRYYVGFSGSMVLPRVMGSFSTNVECMFGGFKGRPLMKGDRIGLRDKRKTEQKAVPEEYIPPMNPPHIIRIVDGPEKSYFTPDSIENFCSIEKNSWYAVSAKSNRTGIRLEGEPLQFTEDVPQSIISEGTLPGTIQVPGDGLPIIVLYERTIGGYARIGVVAGADRDQLAHLKPKDKVLFDRITLEEALKLGNARRGYTSSLYKTIGG